jgi:Flp pilus assembly protein TadG
MQRRLSLRSASCWKRGQRGQTMVILAFLVLFMLLLLGLVIDSARLFILTAQAVRAAEAGSLAGALYMPNYYDSTHPSPDGQYAVKRVCAAVQQNGVANCPVALGQIGATPSTVAGNQYELQVTVTLQANVFFLAYINPGLTTATVAQSAVSQYLPPIELGSRYPYFGDQSTDDANKYNHGVLLQNFWAFINGPLELQEHGDAYTPTYQEGPTDPQKYPDAGSYSLNFNRWAPAACCTDHQQWGGGPIANPDQHPAGFTGVKGTLGYNYEITIPQGSPSLEVQIFNPAFDPNDAVTGDGLDSACLDPKFNNCATTDDPKEYMQLTYSIYSAPLQFERSQDTLLTSKSYPSLDTIISDRTKHGCSLLPYYDPVAKSCVLDPGYIDKWAVLPDSTGLLPLLLGPGTYRLVIESTGYYGRHGYGIKLTDALNNLGPAGTGIWGWNDMCVHFNTTGSTSVFDLGEIPASYASKTLNFSLFDPGDANGNVYMEILDPTGNPVQVPAWVRTVAGSGGTEIAASINGDEYYNGLWLHLPIPIPANYNPAAGSDWWTIKYITTGTPSDTITISISLSGSPIHLVQLLN